MSILRSFDPDTTDTSTSGAGLVRGAFARVNDTHPSQANGLVTHSGTRLGFARDASPLTSFTHSQSRLLFSSPPYLFLPLLPS